MSSTYRTLKLVYYNPLTYNRYHVLGVGVRVTLDCACNWKGRGGGGVEILGLVRYGLDRTA